MVAFCTPRVVGLKVTVNIAEPLGPAIGLAGVSVPIVKFELEEVMLLMVKSVLPVLKMVKVRARLPLTSKLPNLVWSVVEGVMSPSAMSVPLPFTLISGLRLKFPLQYGVRVGTVVVQVPPLVMKPFRHEFDLSAVILPLFSSKFQYVVRLLQSGSQSAVVLL